MGKQQALYSLYLGMSSGRWELRFGVGRRWWTWSLGPNRLLAASLLLLAGL